MIDFERVAKRKAATIRVMRQAGEAVGGLLRARRTPVCVIVLDSPADVWPTAFQGFRREARLTPGYARPAFQAEEERRRTHLIIVRGGRAIEQTLPVGKVRVCGIRPSTPIAERGDRD